MRTIYRIIITMGVVLILTVIYAHNTFVETVRYKCMVQLTNYVGEGAYVVVSLVDPAGKYDGTLYVFGDDREWYEDLKHWWTFHSAANENIDAITGESIVGGARKMITIAVPVSKRDAGYKLRFETAVEDQKYHDRDIEVPFGTNMTKDKIEGSGYIRYVRLMPI